MWVIIGLILIGCCFSFFINFCFVIINYNIIGYIDEEIGSEIRLGFISLLTAIVCIVMFNLEPMTLLTTYNVDTYIEEKLYQFDKLTEKSNYKIRYNNGSYKFVTDTTNKKPVSISEFAPIQFGLNKIVVNFEEQKEE